jgi:hypothetical protein
MTLDYSLHTPLLWQLLLPSNTIQFLPLLSPVLRTTTISNCTLTSCRRTAGCATRHY